MARNLWLEYVIDAYLQACADGRDWKEAVAEAGRAGGSRRALTREDLKEKKGIPFCRQHLRRKARKGTFPAPFQAP